MAYSRIDALALDASDSLASLRERFVIPSDVIYLDGNSLGALPCGVAARLASVVEDEWGRQLIRAWNDSGWIGAPRRVGAKIARLIGAQPDEVVVADSTSVNLFKLLVSAARLRPERKVLLTETNNFPTDLYIIDSVADLLKLAVVRREPDRILQSLDENVAVLALTHVDYRGGRLRSMREATAASHAEGALVLWDLSHSAGVVDIQTGRDGVDFAAGCGYKYLNGGPGAPAFAFAARRHHDPIRQPLTGWLSHEAPFAFANHYAPASGIDRLQCGTPPILSLLALDQALEAFDGVDLALLRQKSQALGDLFIALFDEVLAARDFELASPRDSEVRGSQVSLRHPQGYAMVQALIARGIIGDFRAPDILRFGFAPLYVRFVDIFDAVTAIAEIVERQEWNQRRFLAQRFVT